jgi:hypothetical protein
MGRCIPILGTWWRMRTLGTWDWLWLFQSRQILVRLQQRTEQTNKLKWDNQTRQLKWANQTGELTWANQTRQLKWANQTGELTWANWTNWLNWAKHPANFTRLTELEKANSSWANQRVLVSWKLPSIGPTSKIFLTSTNFSINLQSQWQLKMWHHQASCNY